MGGEPERTPGGSEVFRHKEMPVWPPPISTGDPALIEAIQQHIEKHLGPTEQVIHEVVSPFVHIDVHVVRPAPSRPYSTLVTSGMSERPMKTPPDKPAPSRVELVMCLPADWNFEELTKSNAPGAWPLNVLKMTARLPHALETWLGEGHTIPNDESGTPYHPDTNMCCALLAQSATTEEPFHKLRLDDHTEVHFLGLWFITKEEMDYKLKHGSEALMERLVFNNQSELLVRNRSPSLTSIVIPEDLFGDSFASRPAGINARWNDLFSCWNILTYPTLALFVLGTALTTAGAFAPSVKVSQFLVGFGILALVASIGIGLVAWRVLKHTRIIFKHGALVPGLVVDDKQGLLVATLVNMSHSGSQPWYVVKVQIQGIPPNPAQLLATGAQVPTVCTFQRAKPGSAPEEMGRWAEVDVRVAHSANSDPKVIDALMKRFKTDEWDELRRALDQVPKPIQPGTYPVNLTASKQSGPPPLPIPPPLPEPPKR